PVALLDPVDVGGVTVSRATLHNEREVLKKDIRPGDKVQVIRAGDVIPEILKRIPVRGKKRGQEFSMPKTCPACGTGVEKEGAYYFCPAGLSCPAQLTERIVHFASPGAADIQGLGEKIAGQLVENAYVENIADIYHLDSDELKNLDGFADRSAKKLHRAIQKATDIPLDRFLYALGIRHVGEHTARILSRHFGSLESVRTADVNSLESIAEIGSGTARSIESFFSTETNQKIVDRLLASGMHVRDVQGQSRKTPLEGLTFVFSGKLKGFTRKEAKDLVESLGARASSSVSGQTDVLVAGKDPGSKYEEAREHEVKIIGEEEFSRWMDDVS
ncbi:MAG: NAD-dependent DNA ligase LigA, partial [Desulfomonilia bacterium]|nr:NAD-dependent DNA ligase LigA [Desulfomonilia bacterium]